MSIYKTIKSVREEINNQITQKGKTVGFVPTMGYLHEGHLSLIDQARKENDVVVVSIFVNPTQFGPTEDFEAYPRDIQRDYDLAVKAGADIIFNPEVEEMYPKEASTIVEIEGDITKYLCGKSRPTHFKGVTTIVTKLFNIVKPTNAYFGQKDAQQLTIIKKMTKELYMDINIVSCAIIREEDGLAKSSRNIYLSEEERSQAIVLNQALVAVKEIFNKGKSEVTKLKDIITKQIMQKSLANIDYIEIVDTKELKPLQYIEEEALVALAVYFGKTRLIDNIILK